MRSAPPPVDGARPPPRRAAPARGSARPRPRYRPTGTTIRASSVSSVTRPVRPLISTMRPLLPSVRLRPHSPTRGAADSASSATGSAGAVAAPAAPCALQVGRQPVHGLGGGRPLGGTPATGQVALAGQLAPRIGHLALGAGQQVVGRPSRIGQDLGRLPPRAPHAALRQVALRRRGRALAAGPLQLGRARPPARPPGPRASPPWSRARPPAASERRPGSAQAGPGAPRWRRPVTCPAARSRAGRSAAAWPRRRRPRHC